MDDTATQGVSGRTRGRKGAERGRGGGGGVGMCGEERLNEGGEDDCKERDDQVARLEKDENGAEIATSHRREQGMCSDKL